MSRRSAISLRGYYDLNNNKISNSLSPPIFTSQLISFLFKVFLYLKKANVNCSAHIFRTTEVTLLSSVQPHWFSCECDGCVPRLWGVGKNGDLRVCEDLSVFS
ncbi:hypothetical protein Leryth_015738 [Lithospermum erythrorhizon]|nr:hypothetical protein Leryth_015738 [Lithospermum erythrorhizon]